MLTKLFHKVRPFIKSLVVVGLIATLVLGNAHDALAARTGGRIGGGSFRAPRTYTPSPGGGYRGPGYGYPGGGIGFPFLLPFFGFGGFGGLFSILVFVAIANFLVRSFRNSGVSGDVGYTSTSNVSVAKVQVGLLSSARELQEELNDLAQTANTGSSVGRAMLLQEASLALLRHPEYWVYGATESKVVGLASAEAQFNQLSLTERSKFSQETLSNVDSQLRLGTSNTESSEIVTQSEEPGEYIVATVIVGVEGKLELPQINSSEDLRGALQQIGGIGSDRLLAVEILWTPQAEGDTLTTNDILAEYPNLKLV